jgi:hypothetical protein
MKRIVGRSSVLGCGLALSLFLPLAGHAQETTLYQFTGGSDGGNPQRRRFSRCKPDHGLFG